MPDNEELYRIVVDAESASNSLHLFKQNVDAVQSTVINFRTSIDELVAKINGLVLPSQKVGESVKAVGNTVTETAGKAKQAAVSLETLAQAEIATERAAVQMQTSVVKTNAAIEQSIAAHDKLTVSAGSLQVAQLRLRDAQEAVAKSNSDVRLRVFDLAQAQETLKKVIIESAGILDAEAVAMAKDEVELTKTDLVLARLTKDYAENELAAARSAVAHEKLAASTQVEEKQLGALAAQMDRVKSSVKMMSEAEQSAAREQEKLSALRGALTGQKTAQQTAQQFGTFRQDARELIYGGLGVAWAAEAMGATGLAPITQTGLAATAMMTLYNSELQKASRNTGELATATQGWMIMMEKGNLIQLGLGIGAIVAGLVILHESLKQFEDLNKNIVTTGQSFGLTTQQMAAFSLASRAAGVDSADFTRNLGQLNKDIVAVVDGISRGKAPTGQFVQALDALGISLTGTDGKAKASFQVILEMADAFKRESDIARQAGEANELSGRAVELLGIRGAQMVPVLAQGSEVFERYLKLVKDLGIGTDEQTEKFHRLEASTAEFHFVVQAAFAEMGSSMVPIVTGMNGAAEAVVLAFAKLDGGARTLAVGLGIAAGAFAVMRIALLAMSASNPFTLILAGAIALAPLLLGLAANMETTGGRMTEAERKAVSLRAAIKGIGDEISDMTSKPSKEELGLKAQIDVTNAAISQLQARIAGLGTGAMSVAKLREELDNLLKSGATIDQVTQKQKDLAYVITTSSDPALAGEIDLMQQQIDKMKDENIVLSAEEKALKDSRDATGSLVKARTDSAKSITDLASGLIEYRDKLVEAGSADKATIDMINTVVGTINSGAEQVKTAGEATGSAYVTGIGNRKSDAEAAGGALASSALRGLVSQEDSFKRVGAAAGKGWLSGLQDWVENHSHFGAWLNTINDSIENSMYAKSGVTDQSMTSAQLLAARAAELGNDVNPPRVPVPTEGGTPATPPKTGGLTLTTQPAPSHKEPKKEANPVQTAYGEFLAARGDVGDSLADDQYGKLASKAISDLNTGVRQPGASGAGRDLFNQIQGLIEKGREANLPDLAAKFNAVADAAQAALGERTPEAAEAATQAIMGLAAAVSGAQLDKKIAEQVKGMQEALDQLLGDTETGLIGSWESAFEKIEETTNQSFQQMWENVSEGGQAAATQKAGKEAANLYIQGFKEALKGDEFVAGLQDKIDMFVQQTRDKIDTFYAKYENGPDKSLVEFYKTYNQGISSVMDGPKGSSQNVAAAPRGDLFAGMSGSGPTTSAADSQRAAAIEKLNEENRKRAEAVKLEQQKEQIEAQKLAMQLIKEAQIKDQQIQDEVDKFNRQQSDAEKITELKLALENILGVNDAAIRRAKLEREIDAIEQREAREKKAQAEGVLRDLERHQNKMEYFKQEEIAFIHTNIGEGPEADAQIAEVESRWQGTSAQMNAAKDAAQSQLDDASGKVKPLPDRDELLNMIRNFDPKKDLDKAKAQLLAARPEASSYLGPQTAVHYGGSAMGAVTPQIQGLLKTAFPGGTPADFQNRLADLGISPSSIKDLTGPGAADRTAGSLSTSVKHDQTNAHLSSIDKRLAGTVTTRIDDTSIHKMKEVFTEITVVRGGHQDTHQIRQSIMQDSETRRMVSGRY